MLPTNLLALHAARAYAWDTTHYRHRFLLYFELGDHSSDKLQMVGL